MIKLLKAACLAVYLVAALGAAKLVPEIIATPALYAALVLLGAHVFEAAANFAFFKRQSGSISGHLVQTLLYGFLHWGPLRRQSKVAIA